MAHKKAKAEKKKGERVEALLKIPVGLLSGIILYVWGYLVIVMIIVQWIYTLIKDKRHQNIAEFCEYWNTEVYVFYKYLSGVSNERPFPFTPLARIGKFK